MLTYVTLQHVSVHIPFDLERYYALIHRARGPYEESFVLTFKATERMGLECQNKYFPYGPKSRLIRALLYAYTNKIVSDKILNKIRS